MGGGGSYYDRDTYTPNYASSSGYSDSAAKELSRSRVENSLLPEGRRLVSKAKSPIVYAFDVTGSMGNLPKIIFDKMPMMAGQLAEMGYLEDPEMSLAAIGDVYSDEAPVQVGDFSKIRNMDTWLKRIWLEGNGGGQAQESYEFAAYFYARKFEMPNAETPFFLITGDEGFYEKLPANYLAQQFGGRDPEANAQTVFDELKEKFMGNVYLLHRRYANGDDAGIVRQWKKALGADKVIILGDDLAIADTTLGIFALVSGKRTLEQYLADMKTRGQDANRLEMVKESLSPLWKALQAAPKQKAIRVPRLLDSDDDDTKNPPKKAKKPGRL